MIIGRIRWLPAGPGESWSEWYDLNAIPEAFKELKVIAIEVKEEEINKGANNEQSTDQ